MSVVGTAGGTGGFCARAPRPALPPPPRRRPEVARLGADERPISVRRSSESSVVLQSGPYMAATDAFHCGHPHSPVAADVPTPRGSRRTAGRGEVLQPHRGDALQSLNHEDMLQSRRPDEVLQTRRTRRLHGQPCQARGLRRRRQARPLYRQGLGRSRQARLGCRDALRQLRRATGLGRPRQTRERRRGVLRCPRQAIGQRRRVLHRPHRSRSCRRQRWAKGCRQAKVCSNGRRHLQREEQRSHQLS